MLYDLLHDDKKLKKVSIIAVAALVVINIVSYFFLPEKLVMWSAGGVLLSLPKILFLIMIPSITAVDLIVMMGGDSDERRTPFMFAAVFALLDVVAVLLNIFLW